MKLLFHQSNLIGLTPKTLKKLIKMVFGEIIHSKKKKGKIPLKAFKINGIDCFDKTFLANHFFI